MLGLKRSWVCIGFVPDPGGLSKFSASVGVDGVPRVRLRSPQPGTSISGGVLVEIFS